MAAEGKGKIYEGKRKKKDGWGYLLHGPEKCISKESDSEGGGAVDSGK